MLVSPPACDLVLIWTGGGKGGAFKKKKRKKSQKKVGRALKDARPKIDLNQPVMSRDLGNIAEATSKIPSTGTLKTA